MFKTKEQVEDCGGSPKERRLKPSDFIREIKEQLARQPETAEAAKLSWLNCDPALHIKLNGEVYDITYGKRVEQVHDEYIGIFGEDGHWTYKPAEVEEGLTIKNGTKTLIIRAACVPRSVHYAPETIYYSDTAVTDGHLYLSEADNTKAELFAIQMQQRMFGSPIPNLEG